MRLRVHHLAKQLGVPVKDVVRAAETSLGFRISSYNVLLRPEQIDAIRASLGDLSRTGEAWVTRP